MMYGKTINKEKSTVLFSSNTREVQRGEVKAILQISKETMNDKIPWFASSCVGQSKAANFQVFEGQNLAKDPGLEGENVV